MPARSARRGATAAAGWWRGPRANFAAWRGYLPGGGRLGGALPQRRVCAAAIAQSVLLVAVFRRGAAEPDRAAIRMIARHLVLFARAPQLGVGKRRLARDIGAVRALRFERLMLARL